MYDQRENLYIVATCMRHKKPIYEALDGITNPECVDCFWERFTEENEENKDLLDKPNTTMI